MTASDGWEWVKISEVLQTIEKNRKVQRGWSPQCESRVAQTNEWGVLKTTAVQMGSYEPQHNKALPKKLEARGNLEVIAGDFLMTTTGPRNRCGVICLVEETPAQLIFSGKILRFRSNPERIVDKWLLYVLLSPSYQEKLDQLKVGTSDSSVSIGNQQVLDLVIPCPPIEQQHEIVERIESALASIESVAEQLEEVSRKTIMLRRAALLDAHKAIEDSVGAREETLKSLGNWVGGSTPSKAKGEFWIDGSIPWITSKDVKSEFIGASIVNVTDRAIGSSLLKVHPAGSIVLVARSGILEHSLPIAMATVDFTLNQDLKACITRDDVYPEWLFRYLQAHEKELLQRYRKAGTTVANLNFDEFLEHKVALPSPAAQRAICDNISQQMRIVDEIALHATRRLSEIELLRRAVLHEAFTEREVG